MKQTIKRITIIPLRVPVPRERVLCPEYFDQLLHREKDTGEWNQGGVFFGDVPIFAIKMEGDGGPAGWSDSSRIADKQMFIENARGFLGMTLDEVDPRRAMLDVTEANRLAAERGHQYVHPCKALEIAAVDWKARQLDQPLWQMFGEKVRDALRVEYWSAFRTPEGAGKVAAEAREKGFIGLKLKSKLDMDIPGITKAVFDAGGEDFHLNIDPNGRWETAADSIPHANAMLAVSNNVLLEDPVYGDYEAFAAIRKATGIHVGMTIQMPEQVDIAMKADAADSFNCGGTLHQIITSAERAHEVGKPIWLGSGCDTGLSDLFALHLGCTLSACTIGSDLIGNIFRADDLLVSPIEFIGGYGQLPDGPGRGIEADENAIEKYRIDDPIVIE